LKANPIGEPPPVVPGAEAIINPSVGWKGNSFLMAN
jgi:hypothetical protein